MSCIIMRSALVAWGHNPPPNVARIESDYRGRRVITWDEVLADRRKHQAEILAHKRNVTMPRLAMVWVAYFDMDLFGGWQAFVETIKHRTWVDRDGKGYIPQLLKMFPLVLPIGTQEEQWQLWKPAFVQAHRRGIYRGKKRQPRGVAFVGHDGRNITPRRFQL